MGKFLTSLAASFAVSDGQKENTTKREPSVKRKRLHLLYLLNDILYHTKYRVNDASICSKIQPMLVGLLGSAASFKGCLKHQRKIQELLDLWQENNYYSREYVDKLREAVRNAADAGQYVESVAVPEKEEGSTTRVAKSTPYVMPAMHGDASTPWFDLPAGNLMPHIIPNSTRPINPDLIKPLQFVAGPADDTLVLAVKDLMDAVDTIYGKEVDQEGRSWDIDELGQPIMLDEITGEVIDGEGYYGWSRSFCEKMKRRKKGLDMPTDKQFRHSRSRSSSPGDRKRRYSDDNASSEDGFRSRRQRRSYSSSRSPASDRGRRNGHSRTRSRSSSRSPIPSSRSPERSGQFQRDSRPAPPPPDTLPPRPPIPSIPPPPFQQGFNPNFPPPPPPLHNMPFNPQGQQFGVWPPPPPPPIQNIHFNSQSPPIGAWAPPPPPPPGPPPVNYQQQQQQQFGGYPPSGPGGWQQTNGRGSFNGGGWNNGRGRGYRGGRGW